MTHLKKLIKLIFFLIGVTYTFYFVLGFITFFLTGGNLVIETELLIIPIAVLVTVFFKLVKVLKKP